MEEMAENELLNKIADDFFIKQFKEIVDQQIEAQGFPELCKRTVIKELKDTVQKIQDEQLGIKRLIINSVSRYNNLLTSKKNERNPSREENSRVKSSSNASNNLVIVIDDEDDECVDFTTPKTSVSLTSSSTLSLIATSSCSTAPVEISLLSPLSPKDLPITDRVSKSPDIKIYNDSNERTVEHSNHDNSQVLAFSTNSCTTSTEKNSLLTSSSPTISQLTFLGADVARGSLKKCNNEPNICSLGTDVARDNLEKCNNEPNVCSLEKNSPNLENKSINNDLDSPNHEKLDLNNESFKTVHAMDNQDLTIYEPKSRSLRDEEREHTSVLSDDGRKEVSISDSQLLNSDLFNEEKSFNSEKDLHKKSDVESSPPSSPMLTKIISADSSPLPEASSADIETFSPDVFSAPSSQDVPSSPDSQILLRNKQKATSVKFNHRDHSLVYARPDKSDIWYQAEIIKELTPYRNERRFQVHFLSGQKVTQKILIRSVASIHSIDSSIVEIGSRIVAPRPSDTVNSAISKKYKDINNSAGVISVMFAGVVAEVACEQNKFRYLIFFDDGYAQYLPLKKLFPVVFVSKYVWSDVSTECRDFIKEYLQDYPYRPLLNAKIGCAMETEWNGSWWKSKVVSFDGSLIKILFDIDKRSEWVYKGTSRLEPLYKYFTNSANSKNKSKKNDWFIDEKITHPNFGICRYSLKDPKGYQQRLLWDVENQQGEYICQKKENDPKEANPLKLKLININSLKRSNSALSSSSDSSKNSHTEIKHSLKKRRVISDTEESSPERNTKNATLNQEAFSVSSVVEMSPLESTCSISTSSSIGNGMSPSTPLEPSAISSSDDISKKSVMSSNSVLSNTQEDDLKSSLHIHYVPHTCSCACIKDSRNYFDQHRLGIYNYLSIPFQLGWKRESSKKKVNYHRDIYYRAPCGKRMRNLSEVTKYLTQTECKNVCIDMFCFQSNVSCRNHTSKTKPALYRNEDISNGKEICPVVCVNEISTEPPPHVTYINYRIKADDVSINTDPGFLVCCDCTDNCQDKATCQCAKLTIESSNAIDGEIDKNSGYHFRRLKECIATGIYECNQNCACSPVTCYNRVVQNGIQLRLQVFLTENRGWGLRCVDDIPKGTFVCTYAGQVLNEQTANKEGIDFGDEYLAELDHIEVVEQAKEGYESDVPELSNHSIDDMSSEEWQSDSSYSVVLISSDSTDSSDNDDPAVKSKDKCENPVKKEQQVTCVETKSENTETSKVTEIRHVAKKSTGAKVHSYMSHRGKFFMTQRLDAAASNKTSKSSNHLSTRYLYQNDNQMFILDAKSYGNVGRYMNHSCNPNLFVQNVMVDTHDLRFPWVAFFTQHNITAYTELTWDYNYEVGSVPNKQISCKCGSKQCKGRLL